MDYAIGIDLGGTNIKAAAVTPSGEVLEQSSAETRDDGLGGWAAGVRGRIEALEKLAEAAERFCQRAEHPTAYISDSDVAEFRSAINAVSGSGQ